MESCLKNRSSQKCFIGSEITPKRDEHKKEKESVTRNAADLHKMVCYIWQRAEN